MSKQEELLNCLLEGIHLQLTLTLRTQDKILEFFKEEKNILEHLSKHHLAQWHHIKYMVESTKEDLKHLWTKVDNFKEQK